ncbi:PLD nuclease N-terminal domain-containing protein [Protaetiibacter larvae]|uniref:Cardiolipin synthase N-terminal domain-containing protein n=1 Tax=Protaetiibacter larvae TaxID=2592654 RepID=A0A5C1Y5Y7_9MICO|nr:PLD nuclease N-terminal domain-containing protein [Protaetiibacter larvae]QEO08818.1 hypothetical protein FLP23_01570 [Protaetiibacter larvae]
MAVVLRYLPFIIVLVLLIAAIVDLIRIDPSRVRALPKPVWALIIIVIAFVGPILWFAAGREPLEKRNHGRYPSAPVAPDDDPAFLRRIAREKEQEQRIRDLEQRLSELDADPDDDAPKS